MGLFDVFRDQAIDVIRWENPSSDALIWKWDQHFDEIKNKSSLIVTPGLAAIFVHNGKIEAIQEEPGQWTLETDNTPFLSSIKNFMSGFETHDKGEIYFIKTSPIANQKWGTPNPVRYIDPQYNFPVELRAFGNFTFQIADLENFWINYCANQSSVSIDEVRMIIVDRLVGRVGSVLAKKSMSYNEISKHLFDIGEELLSETGSDFETLGLKLSDFRIEDMNFTDKTQDYIDKIIDANVGTQAFNAQANMNQEAINKYSQVKRLDIAETAAGNSGGMMGDMMTMGMGMSVGSQMGQEVTQQMNQSQLKTEGIDDITAKLTKLKTLHEQGLISQEEYNTKKQKLLEEL